jgi:hypothetical protein
MSTGGKSKSPAPTRGTADCLLQKLVELERKKGHGGDADYDVFEFRVSAAGAHVSSRVQLAQCVECRGPRVVWRKLNLRGRHLTMILSGTAAGRAREIRRDGHGGRLA